MNIIKKVLVDIYNNLYDVKIKYKEKRLWKKDLKLQEQLGVPAIMSIDETLDRIVHSDVSVCRYGDGEFKIMDGDSIFFQNDSRTLSKRLKEVIASNRDDVLVCIPTFFDRSEPLELKGLNKEEKKRKKRARRYMNNIIAERRTQWYSYFDMSREYGNSLVSRFYAGVYDYDKSTRWIREWKKLWNGRDLLIVEGEKTRLGVGNDLFDNANSIRRILAPATSAFDSYDKILNTVIQQHKDNELVLIALGPTATVLAYDLALNGIRAIDIGHIDIEYEWYLRKDRTHQKIDGKFVSEAQGGQNVGDIPDSEYENQIIASI